MPELTNEQCEIALQLANEKKFDEMLDYLINVTVGCKYTDSESRRIFTKGFFKGFFVAHELMEYKLNKYRG